MRLRRAVLLAAFVLCGSVQAGSLDAAKLAFTGGAHEWPSAVAQFSTAAAQGDGAASYYLGLMQRNGMGTPRDSVRAAASMQVAADAGIPAAMFILSNMLYAGEGVARDERAGRRWLEVAAEHDYPPAIQQVAMAVRDGALGYERDEVRAEQLVRELAHAMKHQPREP
ncbi:tetratricopeptide repeat protein [Massilia cavernae]|uniref:Sel1 repeat family protein n=1 Tax=Massilia cavernae TaxID=2320864 RepID=A0A418Y4U3_9BURK|nr:tetratricopeptide repeat protein [Massilia cavernae]RJG21080.1 sel1 repeat family protein [Massilia cavernae]